MSSVASIPCSLCLGTSIYQVIHLPSHPSTKAFYHQTCTSADLHCMMCDSLSALVSCRPSWVSTNCLATTLGEDPCSLSLLSVTQHISPYTKHCPLIQDSCAVHIHAVKARFCYQSDIFVLATAGIHLAGTWQERLSGTPASYYYCYHRQLILWVQGADPVACIASSQQPMQFDICIANILRGPLLDLQPRLTAYVKPGGHLLLSGILESQVRRRP